MYAAASDARLGWEDEMTDKREIWPPRTEDLLARMAETKCSCVSDFIVMTQFARQLERELIEAQRDAEAKQAKIDWLMLEYCPDEMTPEQLENWGKHQRPVSKEVAAAIDAAAPPAAMEEK